MSDPKENPYLTATYAPRPTAPFNGIGVLADTQASITHAQEAINTYGYNLDNERDRAQQRVIKDTNYPYAVKQTEYMGQAGVLGAQGARMQAGSAALNQGLAIDQFDPLAGDQGMTRTKEYTDETGKVVPSRLLYGGIDAPTTANPTMTQSQKLTFNQRALNNPYEVGGDVNAQGQAIPLPGATPAALPATPEYTGPYNLQGLNIPGTPSSMVGITRQPQLRPKSGVSPGTVDQARENLEGMITEMSSINRDLREAEMKIAQSSNPVEREWHTSAKRRALRAMDDLTQRERKATAYLQGLTETTGPSELSKEFNNYNIPQATQPQGALGADPLPTAQPNATSYQAPPTMPPQLVPAFNSAASLYTQHAPGGPGGTEAALLFSGLESSFSPVARASGSRAAGLTQFTPDTWMRVAKQLPWAKGKTDEEIAALRASPAHQAQAERQLRMLNYAAATAKFSGQFDPANPLNLYAMHHFGEDTGGKIAAALRKSPNTPLPAIIGPKAWAAALAANPYLANKGIPLTASQLFSNWINRAKTLGFYGGVRA